MVRLLREPRTESSQFSRSAHRSRLTTADSIPVGMEHPESGSATEGWQLFEKVKVMRPEARPTDSLLHSCLAAGLIGIAGLTGCQSTDNYSHDYSYPVPQQMPQGPAYDGQRPYDPQPQPVAPAVPAAPQSDGVTVPMPNQESFFAPPENRRAGATLGDRISGFFRHPRQSSSDRVASSGAQSAATPAHQMRSAGVPGASSRTTGRHPDAWVADSSPGEVLLHARSRSRAQPVDAVQGGLGGHTPPRSRARTLPDDTVAYGDPSSDGTNVGEDGSYESYQDSGDYPGSDELAHPGLAEPLDSSGPALAPVGPSEQTPDNGHGLDLTPELESRRQRRQQIFLPTSSQGNSSQDVTAIPLWQTTEPVKPAPAGAPLLRVQRIQLADEVTAAGVATPLSVAALAPGETALVIAWLENVTAVAGDEGLISETQSQLEIRAWNGIVLSRQDLGAARDVSASARESYFLSHEVAVPADLPAGKYQVTLRVTDRTSGTSAEATTELTVRDAD